MFIVGADLSMNSSGLTKFKLDNRLEIIDIDYLGFTEVKKNSSDKITHYRRKDFTHRYDITEMMLNNILDFVDNADYIAIEDYAFGATGREFHIGEFVGQVKFEFFINGKKIRLYDPNSIKKYATGYGNSDKISMYNSFEKYKGDKPNLNDLPIPKTKSGVSPTSDIIDSFYIAKLLQLELQLRKGFKTLEQLNEEEISIFNRVTKARPINILSEDFIEREVQ